MQGKNEPMNPATGKAFDAIMTLVTAENAPMLEALRAVLEEHGQNRYQAGYLDGRIDSITNTQNRSL